MNNDLYIVINKTKKKINSSKQTNKVLEDKNIFILYRWSILINYI